MSPQLRGVGAVTASDRRAAWLDSPAPQFRDHLRIRTGVRHIDAIEADVKGLALPKGRSTRSTTSMPGGYSCRQGVRAPRRHDMDSAHWGAMDKSKTVSADSVRGRRWTLKMRGQPDRRTP
jgi:hypothetical protein